jgi:hypothetical protein
MQEGDCELKQRPRLVTVTVTVTRVTPYEPDMPLAWQHVTYSLKLELSDGFPHLRDPQKLPTCDEDVLS